MYDQILGGGRTRLLEGITFTWTLIGVVIGVVVGVVVLLAIWGICALTGSDFKPFENSGAMYGCLVGGGGLGGLVGFFVGLRMGSQVPLDD